MKLEIITPTESVTRTISWLEVNTPAGNFVIQVGHAPTMLVLAPGQPLIYYLATGKQETMTVSKGIVHITRDSATVVMSDAILNQEKS